MRIVLVGKYTVLEDAYASVITALRHAAIKAGRKLELQVGYEAQLVLWVYYQWLTCYVLPFDCSSATYTPWTHMPQLIEASDLEPSVEESDPVKFHSAWSTVCSAQYV